MKNIFICLAVLALLASLPLAYANSPLPQNPKTHAYCATEVFTNGLNRELKNIEALNIIFDFTPVYASPFKCDGNPYNCPVWHERTENEIKEAYIKHEKALLTAEALRKTYPKFLYPQNVSDLIEETFIKALREYGGKQADGSPCVLPVVNKPGSVYADANKQNAVDIAIKVHEYQPEYSDDVAQKIFILDMKYYRGASRVLSHELGNIYVLRPNTTKEDLIVEMWKPWKLQVDGPHPE